MLSEGFIDKVLVLCPSLTMEEELKKKFELFSGNEIFRRESCKNSVRRILHRQLKMQTSRFFLEGDICVENIHAAYQRTGSSISDSFKGKGRRTLVISDEAHHIYSEADS